MVDLVAAGEREMTSREFVERWRQNVGDIPGTEMLGFSYTAGATEGPPISIELSHHEVDKLEAAAAELADSLKRYRGVRDVDDGFSRGKRRLNFRLSPAGRAEGLTDAAFANELRAAYFGAEAQRFQRGREEVRVYVRLPKEERRTLEQLKDLVLQTPRGGEIPLTRAASLEWDRSFTRIQRTDLRRTINVTAHLDEGLTASAIVSDLEQEALPGLVARYPGLSYAPGGQQEMQQESVASLASGFAIAVIAMFAALAVAFRSYLQPIVVLFAIPFGMVGAVAGHLLLGYHLSLSSMFGLVALSGVVVNDSLLMVVAINEARQRQPSLLQAVVAGAARRFRPVVMTSLTTFGGLAPMIFETSVQAQFLIPMAISLGFGILFATLILLVLLPSLYVILEDVTAFVRRFTDRARGTVQQHG